MALQGLLLGELLVAAVDLALELHLAVLVPHVRVAVLLVGPALAVVVAALDHLDLAALADVDFLALLVAVEALGRAVVLLEVRVEVLLVVERLGAPVARALEVLGALGVVRLHVRAQHAVRVGLGALQRAAVRVLAAVPGELVAALVAHDGVGVLLVLVHGHSSS